MTIIDAQVHPWRGGEATGHHRKTPITADVLKAEMAGAGVDAVLLVPPLWDPSGNSYALSTAHADANRFAVMGLLQMGHSPPASREALLAWLADPSLVGLRFLFNAPDRIAPLNAGAYDWVWPVAEEAGVPVALLIPDALQVAADIAARHPGLNLIVDHLGAPRGASGPSAFKHLPQLLALERFPNISIKAVAVGDYAPDGYPFASIDAPLRRIFDAFGPRRIIWGSDLSRLQHSYSECVRHFTEALSWLPDADRADVMGANLSRLTGWTPQPSAATENSDKTEKAERTYEGG